MEAVKVLSEYLSGENALPEGMGSWAELLE